MGWNLWPSGYEPDELLTALSRDVSGAKHIPAEFGFVPGNEHDAQTLKKMRLDLPAESEVFADSAYTNYENEDLLLENDQIALKVHRKSNSKRKDSASAAFIKEYMRKELRQ